MKINNSHYFIIQFKRIKKNCDGKKIEDSFVTSLQLILQRANDIKNISPDSYKKIYSKNKIDHFFFFFFLLSLDDMVIVLFLPLQNKIIR
jgi:hypothetical protein